jgi:hypothetical protein
MSMPYVKVQLTAAASMEPDWVGNSASMATHKRLPAKTTGLRSSQTDKMKWLFAYGNGGGKMKQEKRGIARLFEHGLGALNLEWMIPLFSLFLIAMIWSAVLWQVNTDKVRSQLEMQRQSENLVRVFEEHISRTIRAVDQSVLFLKYEYESEGNKMDLPHYIKQGIIQSQLFVQIAIIGRTACWKCPACPTSSGLT